MGRNLTVIMPVYNEENTIVEICQKVLEQDLVGQLIIVDDCSTDQTYDKIHSHLNDSRILILRHSENLGKGSALKTGAKHISKKFVIIQDADLEYDPGQYNKMLEPLLNNQADVVFGSRFQTGETRRVLYFWHFLGNKILTLL